MVTVTQQVSALEQSAMAIMALNWATHRSHTPIEASKTAEMVRQFVREASHAMATVPDEISTPSPDVRRRVQNLAKHVAAIEPTLREFISDHADLLDVATIHGAMTFFESVEALHMKVEEAWRTDCKERFRRALDESLAVNGDLYAELARR